MSGFRFNKVSPFKVIDNNNKRDGIFILLIGATNIPPHIAMLVKGGIYSLSIKGKKENIECDKYLNRLETKGIEILLVEIFPVISEKLDILSSLNGIFEEAPSLGVGGDITCLWPVKNFCSEVFFSDFTTIKYVFDLIPELDKIGGVGDAYQINMENKLDEKGGFELIKYSMSDIQNQLNSLKRNNPKIENTRLC